MDVEGATERDVENAVARITLHGARYPKALEEMTGR